MAQQAAAAEAEAAAAQQAEFEAQQAADLQAILAGQSPAAARIAPYRAPAARRAAPAPRAAVPDTTTPFNEQALAAGLGSGGLGPTTPEPFYQQALGAGLGGGGLGPVAAVTPTDYMAQIPVAPPVDYVPPPYAPPNPVIAAAQSAFRRVPRTRIGAGGWRNPNA